MSRSGTYRRSEDAYCLTVKCTIERMNRMEFSDFTASLREKDEPPSGLGSPLLALWYEARGNWNKAHELVQNDETAEAAWVHAYLHRKEGDLDNALYWYRRAGQKASDLPTDREWTELVNLLLDR
jgi:hypothetical protein